MKPTPTNRTVTGNLTGEKIAFTLADDPTHLMNLLTDIYKDRELACLREYATNALDAHKDGGVSAPIEVNLPGPLNPVLTIRDYGPGLDLDDIRTIFTRYGESTKRGTDDATGMLGIGSKAALTYTDQFTVTSVKGGRKLACSVVRSELGTPELTIVSDKPCADASGVTVTIPTDPDNRFAAKAATLFAFWPEGTVLVDGKDPERWAPDLDLGHTTDPEGRRLHVTVKLRDSDGIIPARQEHSLVMGGVTYPANYPGAHASHRIVAFADIGAVDFLQSREELHDTPRTDEVLARVTEHYKAKIRAEARAILDRATTPAEAIEIVDTWADWLDDFTWKGRPVPYVSRRYGGPSTVEQYDTNRDCVALHPNRYRGVNTSEHNLCAPRGWQDLIFVTGFVPSKIVRQHRTRLEEWAVREGHRDAAGASQTTFMLCRGDKIPREYDGWVEDPIIEDWKVARKTPKVPGAPRAASSRNEGYDAFDPEASPWGAFRYRATLDELGQLRGLLGYVPATDDWSYPHQRRFDQSEAFLTLAPQGSGVVYVPDNRLAKFKRLFPEAVSVRRWLLEQGQHVTFTPAQALARGGVTVGTAAWAQLDPAKVDDPYLRAAIRLCREARHVSQPQADIVLRNAAIPVRCNTITPDLSWVPERYPLAEHGNTDDERVDEHLTLYVNLIHANETKED